MSTERVCLHEREPSAATRRVQPLQLQEVVPSAYRKVSYSMLGLESDEKVQTRVIGLFMSDPEGQAVLKVLADVLKVGLCPALFWGGEVQARIIRSDVVDGLGFHPLFFVFLLVVDS